MNPPHGHPLFALVNFCLIFGAFGIGYRLYLRSHPEPSGVKGSRLLGSTMRAWYFTNLEPFEDWFVRHHVSPAALSFAQLFISVAVGLSYATGLIYTAGFLVLLTGTLDILDGKVARRTSGGTPAGAFLDSVIDRYAEFFGFLGLIVFFGSGWMVWAVLLAILGGTMVSYTRARAEGLGARCEIGLLQRPERFVLLGVGSMLSSLAANLFGVGHVGLWVTVVLLAVLSNFTALQRAIYVHRLLRGTPHA